MIRKVCIVGSGLMGGGIAQVCAQRGIDVSLCDVSECGCLQNQLTLYHSSVL